MATTPAYAFKISVVLFLVGFAACLAQDPHGNDESYVAEPPTRMQQNLVIVKSAYAAFEKADMAAFAELLSNDVVWNEAEGFPYADKNPYIGKDSIVYGVFTRIGNDWAYFKVSDLQIYGMENNMVLATGYYNAKHKNTGKIIKAQMAHLWWLANGKLTKFQQFVDTRQVANAFDQSTDSANQINFKK